MECSIHTAADAATADEMDSIVADARVYKPSRDNAAFDPLSSDCSLFHLGGQVAICGPMCRAEAVVEDAQVAQEESSSADGSENILSAELDKGGEGAKWGAHSKTLG